MNGIWPEVEAALVQHAPELHAALRPPATEAQILAAEQALGLTFPADLRAAYLRHDGVEPGAPKFFAFGFRWCSLDELVSCWQMLRRVEDDMRTHDPEAFEQDEEFLAQSEAQLTPFEAGWIPVGLTGTEHLLFCDMNPAPRGRRGQLIQQGGRVVFVVVEKSLESYLLRMIDALEGGRIEGMDGGYWQLTETKKRISATAWAAMHGDPPIR